MTKDDRDPRVHCKLSQLARLRYEARGFSFGPRAPLQSLLAGRKRSRLRGRGLDFDELRHYRPGDDIRSMDWRVTNRTGKPHVRVYTEERDRPVLLLVDQRQSMFFGSRDRMKSVTAAELAALVAFRVLDAGDRIGAVLFNDVQQQHSRPSRSQQRLLGWLGQLCTLNQALSVSGGTRPDPNALEQALAQAARSISHDYLLVIVSDLQGWNDSCLSQVKTLAQHNDVICALVHDPLERDISAATALVVSDGEMQLELDPANNALGEKFEQRALGGYRQLRKQLAHHAVPVIPISTDTPVSRQLRRLMGGGPLAA